MHGAWAPACQCVQYFTIKDARREGRGELTTDARRMAVANAGVLAPALCWWWSAVGFPAPLLGGGAVWVVVILLVRLVLLHNKMQN